MRVSLPGMNYCSVVDVEILETETNNLLLVADRYEGLFIFEI